MRTLRVVPLRYLVDVPHRCLPYSAACSGQVVCAAGKCSVSSAGHRLGPCSWWRQLLQPLLQRVTGDFRSTFWLQRHKARPAAIHGPLANCDTAQDLVHSRRDIAAVTSSLRGKWRALIEPRQRIWHPNSNVFTKAKLSFWLQMNERVNDWMNLRFIFPIGAPGDVNSVIFDLYRQTWMFVVYTCTWQQFCCLKFLDVYLYNLLISTEKLQTIYIHKCFLTATWNEIPKH